MHPKRALAAVLLLFAACGGERLPERPPVLLLAVDGLEWSVLLPMVQRGEMPALRALMERGVFGKLETLSPTSSPIIWTTIATGKGPDEHGIHGFVYDDGGKDQLYVSADRKVKAFWNVLTDYGLDCAVLGWWITWPAERIRGLMVAQTNTSPEQDNRLLKGALYKEAPDQVFPPAEERRALEVLGAVEADLDGILEREYGLRSDDLPQPEARLVEATRWSLRADETYLRIALDRLERGDPPALTAVYTGGTDVIGHRFWRYAYPEQFEKPVPADRVERFGGLLAASYRRVDRVLAQLLERLPPDATVLIVSDHGMQAIHQEHAFGPDDSLVDLLSGHHPDAPPGVVIAAGGCIQRPSAPPNLDQLQLDALPTLASVMDVTPTLLALLGIPVGDDMQGRPRVEWFEAACLQDAPPRTLPTHESAKWQEQRKKLQMQAKDSEDRINQLKGLGYIGDEPK
jgi:predicted AlkP superfamily pyrophosphatase or phosphodiesterase